MRDGRDILIREDDRGLADGCIQLLGDDALCARLGRSAYETARTAYDHEAVKKRIMAEAASILAAQNHVVAN